YYSIDTGKACITIKFPADFPSSAPIITDGNNLEMPPVVGAFQPFEDSQAQIIVQAAQKFAGG
ncbi:MAG: hypothetical protein ACK40Q_10345, partial [Pseudothermotoga sp.]